jgi:HK97 family phage portal protein
MGLRGLLGFDSVQLDRANEIPQIDPRTHTPNDNLPPGTVGPQSEPGEVMGTESWQVSPGRWHAEAWAGWPAGWGTPWMESGTDNWSGFGYGRHDPSGYMGRVGTVMTCVDRNSSQLASFPLYGVDGLETEELPTWARNPMPGLYADWSDFALELANSMMLDGEAIVWATDRYADGYPARFMCLPARRVDIDYDRDLGRIVYEFERDRLRTADVCHIRYQKLVGEFRGISPLQWIGRSLVSASILEKYALQIAINGPEAVLTHPGRLTKEQRDEAKLNWVEGRYTVPGAPRVVSGGWSLEFPTLSPKDMALLDLRILDDQRIAAAFRMQPYLVGVEQPGSMTYDNSQLVGDHHWRIGLRPLAKKIATAMSAWALPGQRRMEFNRDEYVDPGFGERATAYSTMHGIVNEEGEHAMTVDEIRIRERFDPTPDESGEATALVGANP